MEKPHQTTIRKNIPYLVDNLRAVDIIDQLFADDCLTLDEHETLEITPGDRAKCRQLLLMLMKKGEKTFSSFIKALESSGNDYIKEQLLFTFRDLTFKPKDPNNLDIDPSQILLPSKNSQDLVLPYECSEQSKLYPHRSANSDVEWFTSYCLSVQNKRLTDKELTVLSLELMDIDTLGSMLNIPANRIQIHKLNHPQNVTTQISMLLQAWKRECGSGAQLNVLVDALHRGKLLNTQVKNVITEICEGKI